MRREDTFITNACLCRPRDNATPTARDVAACSERLKTEVTEAVSDGAPIIALGNVAASAIFGQKIAITSFRAGPPKESPLYPGTRVIPTVHPAYVLRAADAFPLFQGDIGKAKQRVDIRWEAPTFRVFDSEVDACKALHELQRRDGNVVVDIEVGVEKDEQFVHPDQYRLLCVGLCYAPGRAIVIGETALHSTRANGFSTVRHMLGRVLENRRARIVAHNGKFDLAGLKHIAPLATLGFDTMLASYAVDEQPGTHGLKYLAQEKLGAPKYDLEVNKYLDKNKNFSHVPREILYKYNAYDTTCTYGAMDYYEATMSADERRVHGMLVRASNVFMPAEMKGLTVDIDYVSKLTDEFEVTLMGLEDILAKWVSNPRSPMQVKEALLNLGVRVASTNKETLALLQRRNISDECREFVELLLQHRKQAKLYGTYVKGIYKRLYKGRVHPTYMLHGTTTGRLACRNPNLFNIPRGSGMRNMFIPTPGRVFVQGDYKGAELHVIACEARDEYLRGLFAEGRDIHNEVAERFFGPGFTKDQRVRAKAVVFGLPYGREAQSLAQEFNMPTAEAQRYLEEFFQMIPDTVRWYDALVDKILHSEDDLVTHFGRHRRFWLLTDDNVRDVIKEGRAFIPQSTAADITLLAACELVEKYGLDFRLSVYDSIMAECDPDQVEDVKQTMREVMPRVAAEVYSDYVPFDVDVTSGPSWGDL